MSAVLGAPTKGLPQRHVWVKRRSGRWLDSRAKGGGTRLDASGALGRGAGFGSLRIGLAIVAMYRIPNRCSFMLPRLLSFCFWL